MRISREFASTSASTQNKQPSDLHGQRQMGSPLDRSRIGLLTSLALLNEEIFTITP